MAPTPWGGVVYCGWMLRRVCASRAEKRDTCLGVLSALVMVSPSVDSATRKHRPHSSIPPTQPHPGPIPSTPPHPTQPTITLLAPPADKAHSSVQKAANIAGIGSNLRLIPTNTQGSGEEEGGEEGGQEGQQCYTLDVEALAAAMREDAAAGLTPMFVSANVGSTNTCAVDPVRALGEACRR